MNQRISNKLARTAAVILLTACLFLLNGCMSGEPAPVINAWQQPQAKTSHYRVQVGDTIYSIAWNFALDYRTLVAANQLQPPYKLYPGQVLKMAVEQQSPLLTSTVTAASPPSISQAQVPSPAIVQTSPTALSHAPIRTVPESVRPAPVLNMPKQGPVYHWNWPAQGRIVSGFTHSISGNQGVDIAGKFGQPIRASAAGVVVYCGDGIRGYGNLIIIKHNNSFLSAYAHNERILVRVGQSVSARQTIALMGRNDAGRTLLHFEIRYAGKPVNPLIFLHK